MKVLTSGAVVCAMISILAIGAPTVARATPSAIDFKTVTSKAYVDSLIGDVSWDSLSWVVNNDGGANRTNAINVYNTTFGNGANNWAGNATDLINGQFLANSLALKQNKITTGLVEFEGDDATINVPSVVTTNAAGTGVSGNQIGFMTLSAFAPTATPFSDFEDRDDGDSFVPSAALVAQGLAGKQNILPAAWTDTTNVLFMASTGGQTIDLKTTAGNVGHRYITAGGSQPLTKKSGADNVILYIKGTKTLAQYQASNFGATGGAATTYENYINGALVSLELLKDVYGALHTEITTKQDVLTARAQNAPVTIPTYPAYGQTDGTLGQMFLDTTTLYTTDDSHFPSSKLLNTKLGLYLPKADVYNTANLNSDLSTNYTGAPSWVTSNGVVSLYSIPSAANGSNWAATALSTWSTNKIVPTMDTLARSLSGLYDAVNGNIYDHILNYEQTKGSIADASVPVPAQIAYTGESILTDGNQLFWLPQLEDAGDDKAGHLMDVYANRKFAPSMDELARALDGVLQTHETTTEWRNAVDAQIGDGKVKTLFELAEIIEKDADAVNFYKTGYLQTFAPTLEALMDESYSLYELIDAKQDKLIGTSGNLVTYGATAGQTGSKAIATSITNNANTVPNTAAVYNAVNARQIKIPQAGRVRDASGTLAFISDWTSASVKGTRLVTKTSSDGVVGERKIFEAGATYTNNDATNIQIATIGAVMENTVTKRCYQYRPNMPESTANCWLWEFTGNAGACENPVICRTDTDCCSGFACVGDGVERVCMAVHESGNTVVGDKPVP